MRSKWISFLIFVATVVTSIACGADSAPTAPADQSICGAGTISARPGEIHDVLINPGMGFTSFNRVNGDPLEPGEGFYPEGGIAYYRWYWKDLEPADGDINFSLIDNAIARARERGQKVAFRIMPASNLTNEMPQWLIDKGIPGVLNQGQYFVPDFNDPVFKEHAKRLVLALGKRYDGNPDIDHVDIGMLGLWAEWHVSDIPGAAPISISTQWECIAWHQDAFPRTQLIQLVNSVAGLQRAVKEGKAGWRGDCFGDIGGFSPTWSHMRDMYPFNTASAGVTDAWKRAPVVFEVCWDVSFWVEKGWDIDAILNEGLDIYHCSVINAKSMPIPESARSAIEACQKRMGYRLVLRELCHPETIQPGGSLVFSGHWANIGVAPPYKNYRISYRLRDQGGAVVWSGVSSAKVREWPVGNGLKVGESFSMPKGLAPGEYQIDVAVLAPESDVPAIRLAIGGRRDDGWYPVSRIAVR